MENLFHDVISIIKTVISKVKLLDTVFGSASQPSCYVTTSCIQITVFPARMGHILQYSWRHSRITDGVLSNGEAVNVHLHVRFTFTEVLLLQFPSLIRTTHLYVWSDICFAWWIYQLFNTLLLGVLQTHCFETTTSFTLRSRRIWLEVSVGQCGWM